MRWVYTTGAITSIVDTVSIQIALTVTLAPGQGDYITTWWLQEISRKLMILTNTNNNTNRSPNPDPNEGIQRTLGLRRYKVFPRQSVRCQTSDFDKTAFFCAR